MRLITQLVIKLGSISITPVEYNLFWTVKQTSQNVTIEHFFVYINVLQSKSVKTDFKSWINKKSYMISSELDLEYIPGTAAFFFVDFFFVLGPWIVRVIPPKFHALFSHPSPPKKTK